MCVALIRDNPSGAPCVIGCNNQKIAALAKKVSIVFRVFDRRPFSLSQTAAVTLSTVTTSGQCSQCSPNDWQFALAHFMSVE